MKSRIFVFTIMLLIVSISLTAVTGTINFQGALKDANGVPLNGTRIIIFRIYDSTENGTMLWDEQHNSVVISDGIFSQELGSNTPFPADLFDNSELFITFFLDGEEMSPRQKLHSVPYALQTESTNLIQDVPLSGLLQQDMSGNATITGTMTAGSFVGDGSGITNIGSFDDVYVNTTEPDTITVNGTISALTIENSGTGGGLGIISAGQNGVLVQNAGWNGIAIDHANGDGIKVVSAGSPSTEILSTENNGFEVEGAEGNGLYVGRADLNGVHVESTGSDGVSVMNAGTDGVYVFHANNTGLGIFSCDGMGVFVNSAGADGVYANTTQASGEWGFNTPDKINGSNITTRIQSTHVRYVGNEMLETGDLVCIAGGYEEYVLGEGDDQPVVHVTKANSINSEAVLGVVEYKVNIRTKSDGVDDRKTENRKSFRYTAGSISQGDYLSVIVFGPVDVNVSSRSNIKTGEKLTVADNGYTRSITDEDNWRIGILGKALEDANGRGKIKVFVNCR